MAEIKSNTRKKLNNNALRNKNRRVSEKEANKFLFENKCKLRN